MLEQLDGHAQLPAGARHALVGSVVEALVTAASHVEHQSDPHVFERSMRRRLDVTGRNEKREQRQHCGHDDDSTQGHQSAIPRIAQAARTRTRTSRSPNIARAFSTLPSWA